MVEMHGINNGRLCGSAIKSYPGGWWCTAFAADGSALSHGNAATKAEAIRWLKDEASAIRVLMVPARAAVAKAEGRGE